MGLCSFAVLGPIVSSIGLTSPRFRPASAQAKPAQVTADATQAMRCCLLRQEWFAWYMTLRSLPHALAQIMEHVQTSMLPGVEKGGQGLVTLLACAGNIVLDE